MRKINDYITMQAERLESMGRVRTSETYRATMKSFMSFLGRKSIRFDQMDCALIERYEAWLRQHHLSRNSTSFYMRVLRCNYNLAVNDGLTKQKFPFRNVYTGIDKTAKRAITSHDIKAIRQLELDRGTSLELARDLFLFSFYMRGMSFVDMAYLRKCNLRNGYLTYNRKKTNQQLSIRWEQAMQDIVERHTNTGTQYLLPIIEHEDGTERRQYLNKQLYINRKLKVIASLAHLSEPLTMYVARHSWASIAYEKRIPVGIISEAMGHDSESTTQIYLTSIQTALIDEANRRIIQSI